MIGGGGGSTRTSDWEGRAVALLIGFTVLLSSLPYLLGYYIVPPGTRFIGTAYNIDDYCNYLSWLRQAADGHFHLHNLFTTDPQKDLEFNVLFWVVGRLGHHLHAEPALLYQATRVLGGVALLGLIWRFYRHCLPGDRAARLTAFGFACLSSGFGWAVWSRWHDKNGPHGPVDAWQPEAYTFLSLYTSPLFVVSTLLILGALFALLRGEETGRWRFPVVAGLCAAVLGNIHSYDVLHLTCAWGLYLIVWTVIQHGRGIALSWLRGIAALAIAAPTTLYQLYIYHAEAVFHKRADTPTLSPALWHYALGYGLVFFLALGAAVWLWRRRDGAPSRPLLFAACWAVGGFVAAYLPLPFQRKMLMGEHVPLCLLAGVGAAALVRARIRRPALRAAALALLVLAAAPSSALFLLRDVNHLIGNRSETGMQPFPPDSLYQSYGWIEHKLSPRRDAVLGFATNSGPLPGATDRPVWVGHWSETPLYGLKVAAFNRFADAATPDFDSGLRDPAPPGVRLDLSTEQGLKHILKQFSRVRFLQSIPATYLLYPNDVSHFSYKDKQGQFHQYADFAHRPPAYLQAAYRNRDFTVFRIVLPPNAPH